MSPEQRYLLIIRRKTKIWLNCSQQWAYKCKIKIHDLDSCVIETRSQSRKRCLRSPCYVTVGNRSAQWLSAVSDEKTAKFQIICVLNSHSVQKHKTKTFTALQHTHTLRLYGFRPFRIGFTWTSDTQVDIVLFALLRFRQVESSRSCKH